MSMQIYKVGGCVRDRLLREQGVNAPTGDIDWVVTGATPEAMLARGFMLNYNWYRHYFPLTSLGRAEKYFENQK